MRRLWERYRCYAYVCHSLSSPAASFAQLALTRPGRSSLKADGSDLLFRFCNDFLWQRRIEQLLGHLLAIMSRPPQEPHQRPSFELLRLFLIDKKVGE